LHVTSTQGQELTSTFVPDPHTFPLLASCHCHGLEWRDDDRFLSALNDSDQLLPVWLGHVEFIHRLLHVIHECFSFVFGDHEMLARVTH
jgi:hypothetical protein